MNKKATKKPAAKAKKPAAKPAQAKKVTATKKTVAEAPDLPATKSVKPQKNYADDVRLLEAKLATLTEKCTALEKKLNSYEKKLVAPPAPVAPPTQSKTMFDTIDFSKPVVKMDDAVKTADKAQPSSGLSPIIRACMTRNETRFQPSVTSPFARI